jgi:hypothetical protein
MAKRLHLAVFAFVGTLAAILPLRGDPRVTPVTHPEWARLLLRALEVPDAIRATPRASHAFAALSWKTSLAFRGDDYSAAEHVQPAGEGRVVADAPGGEVTYPLSIVRPGDYRLRVLAAGNPEAALTAEIRPFGQREATATFEVVPGPQAVWLEAGATHLDTGAYTASLVLPPGTRVEHLEVAPPCVSAVEPRGGWRPTAIVNATDLAVTTLQAVDGESELPPAASPIEVGASAFRSEEPRLLEIAGGQAFEALRGGKEGLRAWALFDLPEDGLYTLSVFGLKGSGQRRLADHCLKAVLCPSPQESHADWWVVTTADMTAGRHAIGVNLGPGASVERIRLERKKASDEDYVATLRRLGFDVGAAGNVTRAKAVDAMEWVRGRRRQSARVACGDVIPRDEVDTTVASQSAGTTTPPTSGGGTTTPPGGVDPPGGAGPGRPPGPNPPLPLPAPSQPPGSEVTITSGSGR